MEEVKDDTESLVLSGLPLPRALIFNRRLDMLRRLDLSYNGLEEVVFPSLPSLEQLNVSHNRLVSLGGLVGLKALVALDVTHNMLDEDGLRPLVFLPRLRTLSIAGNRVRRPRCFVCDNMPNVMTLDGAPVHGTLGSYTLSPARPRPAKKAELDLSALLAYGLFTQDGHVNVQEAQQEEAPVRTGQLVDTLKKLSLTPNETSFIPLK